MWRCWCCAPLRQHPIWHASTDAGDLTYGRYACSTPHIAAHRSEADSQVSSLRSQAAAREERLAAQHACRMAQLQSELDAQAAAAADTEAALAAAKAQVEHLTGQVRGFGWLALCMIPAVAHPQQGTGSGLVKTVQVMRCAAQ